MAEREDRLAVALLEQGEGVLHPLVARQPFERGQLERLGKLLAGEVGCADGADLPGPHELVEREQRLLLRDVRVERVRHVQRDALDSEPLEARLELAADARSAPGRGPGPHPSG